MCSRRYFGAVAHAVLQLVKSAVGKYRCNRVATFASYKGLVRMPERIGAKKAAKPEVLCARN
jgi:hypothetical protein